MKEEFENRNKFDFKKLSERTLENLDKSKYSSTEKENEMIGVLTYQILDNPHY